MTHNEQRFVKVGNLENFSFTFALVLIIVLLLKSSTPAPLLQSDLLAEVRSSIALNKNVSWDAQCLMQLADHLQS